MVIKPLHLGPQPLISPEAQADTRVIEAVCRPRRIRVVLTSSLGNRTLQIIKSENTTPADS